MSENLFPKENILASLRVSTVSHASPALPFAMHLDLPPTPLVTAPRLQDLKSTTRASYIWVSSQQYPYITPELLFFEPATYSTPSVAAGNEVKSFMVKREAGDAAPRDWMPYLFQALESQNVLSKTGYFIDQLTGEILREGHPRIVDWNKEDRPGRFITVFGQDTFSSFRFSSVSPEYHFAEILSTKTAYDQFLATGRPQGLLKMYLGYGFQIETASIKVLEKYEDLMVIPLSIKRLDWLKAVVGTERRPGQKHIVKTQISTRTFPAVAQRLGLLLINKFENITFSM